MCSSYIEVFKVAGLPKTAYYIPDFISAAEEQYLLDKIYAAPKPKWKHLSNRRLQNWGGLPHPKGMIQEPLPEWLKNYVNRVSELGMFQENAPNHVLINEYQPGQGIMPHEDGPLFFPTITTINLGSHAVLDYYSKKDNEDNTESLGESVKKDVCHSVGSLLLERRSLLVVRDDLYTSYLHGIEEKTMDKISPTVANLKTCSASVGCELRRDTRISVTIRNVPLVSKAKFLFGTHCLK